MFFSPATQQVIRKKTVIAASHEIRPEILVHVMLKVLSMEEPTQTFKATAGVRELDDTTLSIGSKLLLKASSLGEPGKRLYTCRVEDVEVRQGKTVHIIRVVEARDPGYERRYKRFTADLAVRRGDDIHFRAANVSQGGMQVLCQNKLTSALIDHPTMMYLDVNGLQTPFECRPRYIVYSWWDQCHQVGVEFVNVTPVQQTVLKDLLGQLGAADSDWVDEPPAQQAPPPPVPAAAEASPQSRKTRIDPETGRILPM